MQAAEELLAKPGSDSSKAVVASMKQHGIAFTASNYAVWQGYLSGSNPAVTRAINIVLSNGKMLDERALEGLYLRHFCPAQRAQQLRDLAQFGLQKVEEACAFLKDDAEPNAAAGCLEGLRQQMRLLVSASRTLSSQLDQSQQHVVVLENFLNDATRDASTDALTGLSNRRAFDNALRKAAADAMNTGSSLGFVLIDIDHFKLVNDHWGHPAGDEVLRQVAAILTRTVRGGDMVARYGGEEFAVILPHTGRRGAMAVAENLREAVAAAPFCVPDTPEASTGLVYLDITMSAGISCFAAGESLGRWLKRADVALYCAKHAGRNRVMFGSTNQIPQMMAAAVPAEPAPT